MKKHKHKFKIIKSNVCDEYKECDCGAFKCIAK